MDLAGSEMTKKTHSEGNVLLLVVEAFSFSQFVYERLVHAVRKCYVPQEKPWRRPTISIRV